MDLKEQYQINKNIPSSRSQSPLKPQITLSISGLSHMSISDIMNKVKAGKERSMKTIAEFEEKERLAEHLEIELNLLMDRYKILTEEVEIAKIQEEDYENRLRSLAEEL